MVNYLPLKEEQYSTYLTRLFGTEKEIHGIQLQVTEDCCMACTYCYQHNKSNNKMTFETAKQLIDNLLADKYDNINRNNTFAISLDFIGGEPLLEIDLIEQIWIYYYSQLIILKHPWRYYARMDICSNGLLYNTPKVQAFFKKYSQFLSFTISIDGNQELHDSCRVDLNGQGTYLRAINAVKHYRETYHGNPGTKMTLAPNNITYLNSAIQNLIKEKYQFIHLNCVFESGWTVEHAQIMYQELKNIADYIIDNNLYNKIYISLFEESYFSPMDESDNENWCGGIADKSLAIDYNGDLYPCIRYMKSSLNNKQEPIILGNVFQGYKNNSFYSQNYEKINNITRRSQSTDECFYCPIAKGCAWCSAYNYEEFGTPNKRATYICYMHQARALANVYYWNKLYQYLNIDKKFKMYLPKEWALNIVDEKEYNNLLILAEGET